VFCMLLFFRMWKSLLFVIVLSEILYPSGPSAVSKSIRKEYHYVSMSKTWADAQSYCRKMFTDLATVENQDDNSKLLENSWIGLHRDKWASWSDGKPTTFTNWNESQPDNSGKSASSCAVVNTTTGTWWDVNCWDYHYFICQKFKNLV
uniref:C-type lectin domain-containing protein n=1 Tax=Lates calcarifer TaxID=8187 RepID=A0A4W6FI23_LATCA